MTEQELGAAMLAFEINAGRTDPRIKIRAAADRRGVPMGNSQKRVLIKVAHPPSNVRVTIKRCTKR